MSLAREYYGYKSQLLFSIREFPVLQQQVMHSDLFLQAFNRFLFLFFGKHSTNKNEYSKSLIYKMLSL